MRPSSSILRTLLKASGFVVPCLFSLAVAEVARADQSQVSATPRRRQMVCDPRMAPLRKVMAAKASQGPVASRSKRMPRGLTDTMARLLRASRTKLDEDAEAIQNDASWVRARGKPEREGDTRVDYQRPVLVQLFQ